VTGSLDAEILRNAIAVAAEEASMVVVRGAYSLYILEGADAAAAVLDARGRLVGHSASTSLAHGASLRCTLPGVIAAHPLSTMEPGDVFVTNDVYRGGIHANDLILLRPVFVGAEPTYFTGTLIHVADLGGVSAGGVASSAQEIFLEGLQLPPVRVATAQGLVADVMAILAANSRQPDRLLGDVRALVAGTLVAARRIDALVERYGAAGFAAGVDEAIDYSRTRMRQEIATFPDGVFSGSYTIDDDGIRIGRPLRVNVTVRVSGEEILVDFEGTDAQVPASVNAGFSQVISGVMYAVRCFLDPTIPMNEGCFDVVDVRLPPGSLVNPGWPFPAGGRYVTVSAAVEAIYRALSRARPDLAVAASGLIHPFCIAGTNGAWVHNAFDYGGMGARFGKDGADATGGLFGGGRNLVPQTEAIEARVPVRIESVEVIPDSGGPGRWRGGLATRTVIRLLEDGVVDTRTDRTRHGPEGLEGGRPGRPGGFYRLTPTGERSAIGSKVTGAALNAGDALIIETSGGGGLGPPSARPPDRLEEDLRTGRVSAGGAGDYRPTTNSGPPAAADAGPIEQRD
jgi:N-methylhydantoinase B